MSSFLVIVLILLFRLFIFLSSSGYSFISTFLSCLSSSSPNYNPYLLHLLFLSIHFRFLPCFPFLLFFIYTFCFSCLPFPYFSSWSSACFYSTTYFLPYLRFVILLHLLFVLFNFLFFLAFSFFYSSFSGCLFPIFIFNPLLLVIILLYYFFPPCISLLSSTSSICFIRHLVCLYIPFLDRFLQRHPSSYSSVSSLWFFFSFYSFFSTSITPFTVSLIF